MKPTFHTLLGLLTILATGLPSTQAQDAQTGSGGQTINIPQINGSITIPDGWVVADKAMMEAGISMMSFSSEQEKQEAIASTDFLLANGVTVLKHPEPYEGWNTSLSIIWAEVHPEFENFPEEMKRGMAEAAMEGMVQSKMQSGGIESVISPPTFVGDSAMMQASVRIKEDRYADKPVGNFVLDIFCLPRGSKVLFVASSYEESERETSAKELDSILQSFK